MKKLQSHEILAYLLFGLLTTLVYLSVRTSLYTFLGASATYASAVANFTAIIFAFVTNDRIVFRQNPQNWQVRFIKFVSARLLTFCLDLALAYLLIDRYPQFIGQFVHYNLEMVNLIESIGAQIFLIVLNYILSKLFIFTKKKD